MCKRCTLVVPHVASQDAELKWKEKRCLNTAPVERGSKRQYEKVNLEAYRREETFTEVWREGEALGLDAYLSSVSIDPSQFGSTAAKVRFLEQDGV